MRSAADIHLGDVVLCRETRLTEWVVWRIHLGKRWSGIPHWVELLRVSNMDSRKANGRVVSRTLTSVHECPAGQLSIVRHERVSLAGLDSFMMALGMNREIAGEPGFPNGPAIIRNGVAVATEQPYCAPTRAKVSR